MPKKSGFTELVCKINWINVNFLPFWTVTVVIATNETLYPLTLFVGPESYSSVQSYRFILICDYLKKV